MTTVQTHYVNDSVQLEAVNLWDGEELVRSSDKTRAAEPDRPPSVKE